MSDSILWNNAAFHGDEIALSGSSHRTAELTVDFSDIMGGQASVYIGPGGYLIWNENNINSDPLFTTGPLGGYYLSHYAAGQPNDSPCVDSGSDSSENICMQTLDGEICLDDLTTRTDQLIDTVQADMGYHSAMFNPPPCINDGDVDMNGQLTPNDANMSFRIFLQLIPVPTYEETCSADCDGNETITPADGLCIYQNYLSGECFCADEVVTGD